MDLVHTGTPRDTTDRGRAGRWPIPNAVRGDQCDAKGEGMIVEPVPDDAVLVAIALAGDTPHALAITGKLNGIGHTRSSTWMARRLRTMWEDGKIRRVNSSLRIGATRWFYSATD